MSHLIFPDRVTVVAHEWTSVGRRPYSGQEIVFDIGTFARAKNDYSLGPFFCDHAGVLTITRHQLELATAAVLSTGLMDYQGIEESYSLIQIRHLSQERVAATIKARTTTWTAELDGERELYGSVTQLVERLRGSANIKLQPPSMTFAHIRDEWDGSIRAAEYEYPVSYLKKR